MIGQTLGHQHLVEKARGRHGPRLFGSSWCIGFLIILAYALGMAVITSGQSGSGTDWPQWRGPARNGLSNESGLMAEWPTSGPPLVWSTSNVGAGYGSITVKGDRIFLQGMKGKGSTVSSLNRPDGELVWSKVLGPARKNNRGPGPRGTPTADGDRLYVLTESGDLACLSADDGSVLWQRNLLRDFGSRNIPWLISESPLVDENTVFVTPGGRNGGIAALDKMSGATIWTSQELSDRAGYASTIIADVQGVRTVMTLTAEAGVGVRALDGQLMWRYRRVGLDPISWTLSERRIRCPRWPNQPGTGDPAGSLMRSSKPEPYGWFSTRARPWDASLGIWT